MTAGEWGAMGAVLGALLLLLPAARKLGTSEISRKAVHVTMGLVCLSFPWIFYRPLPVWVLAALATIPLVLVRVVPSLKRSFGAALHGVGRASYGEILFAPAIALVFQLSGGNPFLFGIPVAILALADAAGALGGTKWGRARYASGSGFKSIEGSLIFWAAAFLCVFPPLFWGGRTDLLTGLLIGVVLATLAMLAEGTADRGFDNLAIPLLSVFVLGRLLDSTDALLLYRAGTLLVLLLLALAATRWTTLNGGALLGGALLVYACAIWRDWRFALPLLGIFASHLWISKALRLRGTLTHSLSDVISHAMGCLPWVFLPIPTDRALVGVSFAMMAQLATMNRSGSVAKGALLAALPGLIWLWPAWRHIAPLWLAAGLLSLAAVRLNARSGGLWWVRGILSLVASLPALYLPV